MVRAAFSLRRAIALAGTLVFLALILLPLADHAFRLAPEVDLMENEPAPLPEFSSTDFFKYFNIIQHGYLEKTFGFRKNLVRLENILDYLWLQASNEYQTVIKGRGDWLFLAQENNELNVIEDYRAGRLFTPDQLAWWVDEYRGRQEWLESRGIRYLVVVAPNKHTVYPESLPERYNKIHAENRTDQLVAALTKAGVAILDLRPAMEQVKKHAQAYYRTDTHWTTFGAFAGYVQIINRLAPWFPGFEPEGLGQFDITITPGLTGGLATMLALSDLFPEDRVTFIPKFERKAVELTTPYPRETYFQPAVVMETGDAAKPTAVIFRDSFAHELVPFLSEHFRRAVYLWPYPSTSREIRQFDKAAIEREKPALVLDEFVERYFTKCPARTKAHTP
ncbi:hypothetical protein DFW101_2915 [Solidesulfovibrio carbinoliphilus subsp. oakridgensis]|uniref:AlgX/AlgJ SGNH hydrolase-like domain-containing protein n=1 Tax=Solidesulfovibrio carbinoliphilus subsp. oakridgensis TaxID=694327 RepID=G7QBQ4_9BACT|nr:hypothetical protein [Solidesulfovibrio carbinoliphilus]EHJ48917.1 hypothetical protein DFW101_2915 [Solidesulfovibrio carbinoliphilus subsp. oakridgensis]